MEQTRINNPRLLHFDYLTILNLSAFCNVSTAVLNQLSELIEKRFFTEGINLKEHSLTAARGDSRKFDYTAFILKKRYAEADTVRACRAVSFKNAHAAS